MKLTIPALGLVAISGAAIASDWQFVGKSVNRSFYVDSSSITNPSSGWTKVWVKVDYSADTTVKYSYSIEHWAFNCGQHTMAVGDVTNYDRQGRVLSSNGAANPSFDVTPDSIGQGIEAVVCAKGSN